MANNSKKWTVIRKSLATLAYKGNTKEDQTRMNYRLNLGRAEGATNTANGYFSVYEDKSIPGNMGMTYPRHSEGHQKEEVATLLDELLPFLSHVYKVFENDLPALGNVTNQLQQKVGLLLFPHRLSMKKDVHGNPIYETVNEQHKLAANCINRLSILHAEGDEALRTTLKTVNDDITNRNRQIPFEKLRNKVNKSYCSNAHYDTNDVGECANLRSGSYEAKHIAIFQTSNRKAMNSTK